MPSGAGIDRSASAAGIVLRQVWSHPRRRISAKYPLVK